jgi:hypothetical protein
MGKKAMKTMAALILSFVLLAVGGPAIAEITQTDVLVVGRAMGFVEGFGGRTVRMGIVFAAGSPQSVQEANELKTILGNQFRVGNNVLVPVLLRSDQVIDTDVGMFFLTGGIGAAAEKVATASKERKIPCITFDLAQVRNGTCTLGVQSQPKIDVFINRHAAAQSNTVLSSVFRLMVHEL